MTQQKKTMPRRFDIVYFYRSVDNEAIFKMLAVSKPAAYYAYVRSLQARQMPK